MYNGNPSDFGKHFFFIRNCFNYQRKSFENEDITNQLAE